MPECSSDRAVRLYCDKSAGRAESLLLEPDHPKVIGLISELPSEHPVSSGERCCRKPPESLSSRSFLDSEDLFLCHINGAEYEINGLDTASTSFTFITTKFLTFFRHRSRHFPASSNLPSSACFSCRTRAGCHGRHFEPWMILKREINLCPTIPVCSEDTNSKFLFHHISPHLSPSAGISCQPAIFSTRRDICLLCATLVLLSILTQNDKNASVKCHCRTVTIKESQELRGSYPQRCFSFFCSSLLACHHRVRYGQNGKCTSL